MENSKSSGNIVVSLFIIIPIIFVILGLWFFPYPISEEVRELLPIPLFGSLILLAIGFLFKKQEITHKLKIAGWIILAFYWSTQPNTLYFGEDHDFVNAFLCIAGVFILCYMAYHEWLSIKRNEEIECLNWFAGVASIAGFIYFIVELTPLAPWLIDVVAAHSGWLLNLFTGTVEVYGPNIYYNDAFAVNIIFACTAVQSMVIFVGMILPLQNVGMKKKIYGLLVTVLPIYFLNMARNAIIAYLLAEDATSFYVAHNIIGKGGSLLALVILLFIVIRVVPEIFDEILALTDLSKRNGPLEKAIKKAIGRKT